jgi:hypothetical protein
MTKDKELLNKTIVLDKKLYTIQDPKRPEDALYRTPLNAKWLHRNTYSALGFIDSHDNKFSNFLVTSLAFAASVAITYGFVYANASSLSILQQNVLLLLAGLVGAGIAYYIKESVRKNVILRHYQSTRILNKSIAEWLKMKYKIELDKGSLDLVVSQVARRTHIPIANSRGPVYPGYYNADMAFHDVKGKHYMLKKTDNEEWFVAPHVSLENGLTEAEEARQRILGNKS